MPIALVLAVAVVSPAARAGEGVDILREDAQWKLYAVRGPMRLNGEILKDPAECERTDVTPSNIRGILTETRRLLQGQDVDLEQADWRDHALYCPDIIGNPYYPRMMSVIRQVPPPADWMAPDFDDGGWMTVWNTRVRGDEGKGSVYNRNLCMRARFHVPDPGQVTKDLTLTLRFRGGARVFLNGEEIARGFLPPGPLDVGEPYPAEAYYNHREESADRKTVVAIGEIWTRFVKGGRSDDPRLRRYRCPAAPAWNGYHGPWLNRDGWERLLNMRDRQIGPIAIPASRLRKGANVLAVELRGAKHHPLIFAPGKWSHGKTRHWNQGKSWDHVALVKLRLTDLTGTLPSAMDPPAGLGVWVEDMHERLYAPMTRPATMPTGTLRFVAALNGTYSGQLSLRSGRKVDRLSVRAGELRQTDGKGVIPADRIEILGMVGEPLTEMVQLGVDGRGTGRDPMNPTSTDALEHLLQGGALDKPRDRPRGWQHELAEKTLFYDHIGSAPPKTIEPGVLQPLWVRLKVPMETPPGVYRGQITVEAEGVKAIVVPVEAEVIGWRVPSPREFITDMGLEHHPYAVANHYLLPEGAPAPRSREWEGPVKAKVPLWSDEHFRLLEGSFRQLGRVGNDLLIVPVLHRTEFGNWEDSMIKWIRRKDSTYDFDYAILDRFLDLAIKHTGTPRVVCFVIMHCQLNSPEPAVTVFDEASGKYETLPLGWQQDAFARLPVWQQFGSKLLEHMRGRGLARSVYWGYAGDHESDPALMGLFWEVFPGHYWAAFGHTYHGGAGGGGHSRNVVRCFSDVYGAATPVESMTGWKGAYIGGAASVETSAGVAHPGQAERLVRNPTYLYLHIPRDEMWGSFGAAHAIRWRGIPSISLHRGYGGLGHIGLDAYHFNYLDGYIGGDWGFPGRPHQALLWPGPDGAEPSARFEAMLEGIQECEARVFLEQALDRGLLDEALAARVKLALLDYINDYCLWPRLRGDLTYDYIHPWQADSRRMLRTAAEVARAVGVDLDQDAVRTRVAALGRTRHTLLLRNWTDQPRAWTARTDADWIKLPATGGTLLGFEEMPYQLDGRDLKPGQTVQGRIAVKDVQTGREQAFHVTADVIAPLELACDHANFNLRCGKEETRRFRLVSHAAVDVDWQLTAEQPWIKIAPSKGTIKPESDLFVTLTAEPPDQDAAIHDNGLVLSGAKGLVNEKLESRTFAIPLLREKEDRKMPYGKIIKVEDIGERFTSFGTCMKGTKIETGRVKEIGRSHTQAFINPQVGVHFNAQKFLPIIGKERFSRAMWVYPHSEAVFDLEGSRIQAVSAYVGVSNDARQRMIRNHHRRVSFEIWVDGRIAVQSGLMKTTDAARYLTVEDLNGAKELKLLTRLDSDKDDNTFVACWCDVNFYAEHEKRTIRTTDESKPADDDASDRGRTP